MGDYEPTRFSLHPVRNIDGALIKNKDMIRARRVRHRQDQENTVHATDPAFLDNLPTLPIIRKGKVMRLKPMAKQILCIYMFLLLFLLWSPSITDDDDFLFKVEDTT